MPKIDTRRDPLTRVFDGQIYHRSVWVANSREKATVIAGGLRRVGYKVRVVESRSIPDHYVLYLRGGKLGNSPVEKNIILNP